MKRNLAVGGILMTLAMVASPAVGAQVRAGTPYEMTTYYLALLYRGPNSTGQATPETQRIQEEHMANIRRMAEAGKLILAGPFSDNGNLRGIFVFRVGSLEEAKALADADPAVKAGRLAPEIHPWFAAKNIHVYATSEEAAASGSAAGNDADKIEQEIKQVESRRFRALIDGDTAALAGILADELTYTHSSGRTDSKAQFIASLQSGELKYESIHTDDVNVRVYGAAAVVTGQASINLKSKGQELHLRLRYTDVYVKHGSAWQMAIWQSTRLAP